MIFASTFSSEISLRFVAQKTQFFFKFIVTYYIDTVVVLLAMPKVSKKRRFHGISSWDVSRNSQTDEETREGSSQEPRNISTPVTETASMRKVGHQTEDEDLENSYSYRMTELSGLLSAFQHLHQCESGGELQMKDDKARRYGNGSVLELECTKCDTKLELQTSGSTTESWTNRSSTDVNRRMVYAACEMGVGREAMATMCDIFNMPPPCNRNAWNSHVNALYDAHKKAVSDNLQKAREKVCSLHQPNDNDVVEIGVSYDGTWSKRGYTANFGIGFVISVDTGEILDYDFESKLCMECSSAKRDLGEDTNEFDIWFTGHKDKCSQSHIGSSGSMECGIAKKIWGRSSEYGIQYKFMICDGDSKAYSSIWDMYGCCDLCEKWENMDKRSKEYKKWVESDDYRKWRESHDSGEVECDRAMKLDCIGHVQKRMGTHLRDLRKREKKLKDGKSVKGSKHRLTDKAIDKLTTYYGNAIRGTVKLGKLTAEQQKSQIVVMQQAIMAALYHSCELIDPNERHKFCPDGNDSWCSYKRQGTLERKDHHLDPVFLDLLLP